MSDNATHWFPSKYGADDEAGALNEVGASNVVRAAALVRTGSVHDLAHVLDEHVPAFPGRTFRQFLTTDPNRRIGSNQVNFVIEYVTPPSQMGSHLDALNHLHDGERMYNGHRLADVVAEHGTTRLGMETLPQVVTRGVLLDIAALRGVERLEAAEVITTADATTALAEAGADAGTRRRRAVPHRLGHPMAPRWHRLLRRPARPGHGLGGGRRHHGPGRCCGRLWQPPTPHHAPSDEGNGS